MIFFFTFAGPETQTALVDGSGSINPPETGWQTAYIVLIKL